MAIPGARALDNSNEPIAHAFGIGTKAIIGDASKEAHAGYYGAQQALSEAKARSEGMDIGAKQAFLADPTLDNYTRMMIIAPGYVSAGADYGAFLQAKQGAPPEAFTPWQLAQGKPYSYTVPGQRQAEAAQYASAQNVAHIHNQPAFQRNALDDKWRREDPREGRTLSGQPAWVSPQSIIDDPGSSLPKLTEPEVSQQR